MTIEITIGTQKQIAWAQDICAKAGMIDHGMKSIADFKAEMATAGLDANLLSSACDMADKAATCAVFWINGASFRLVADAVARALLREPGMAMGHVDLCAALKS